MKKKTLGRIALCAFALCLASTAITSKTLAAFYTEIEGTGNIVVADFTNLTFEKGATNLTATFNLATTKDVNTKVMETTIAPGDQGSFDIVLGASEVAYKYTLALGSIAPVGEGEDAKTVPVSFYSDPEMTIPFAEPAADTGVELATNATTTVEEKITVYWRWETEGAGDLDNDIDYKNLETTFTVDLSASQDVIARS